MKFIKIINPQINTLVNHAKCFNEINKERKMVDKNRQNS